MFNFMERHLFVIFLIGLGAGAMPSARAQDHHPHHADHYSAWTTKDGTSCCSSRIKNPRGGDCAPIDFKRVRTGLNGVEVFIDDEWVAVGPDKIRPYQSPDGYDHLCHIGKRVLCFVSGGAV